MGIARFFRSVASGASLVLGALTWQVSHGCTYSVGDAFFYQPDSTALTPRSEESLQRWAQKIRKYNRLFAVVMSGHTTDQESARLAELRVAQVRKRVVDAGVDPKIVDASAKGAAQPVVAASDKRNARVELEVVGYPTAPVAGKLCGICLCFEKES